MTLDIAMQSPFTATVTVIDQNNAPVPDAVISVMQQVSWINGLSVVGGIPVRSVDRLTMLPGVNNPALRVRRQPVVAGQGKTDQQGRFCLTKLMRNQKFHLFIRTAGSKRSIRRMATIQEDNQEIEIRVTP